MNNLETVLETVQLFEQCFHQGFLNAWQVLPEIQVYQSSQRLTRRYNLDELHRYCARHNRQLDILHETIKSTYASLPYEHLKGKEPFSPIFAFRDELIPQLDTLIVEAKNNPDINLKQPIESLRQRVIQESNAFISNFRASLRELRQFPGYETYTPQVNSAGRRIPLDDERTVEKPPISRFLS